MSERIKINHVEQLRAFAEKFQGVERAGLLAAADEIERLKAAELKQIQYDLSRDPPEGLSPSGKGYGK